MPRDDTNHSTDTTDEYFEQDVRLSRELTVRFLREIANQIEDGTALTITGDDWEIPFEYREPVEIQVELTTQHRRELEIKFAFEEGQSQS